MNENQFNAMLAIIVPHIIELIIKNSNLDTDKAISLFYKSKLYSGTLGRKIKTVALQSYDPIYHVSG